MNYRLVYVIVVTSLMVFSVIPYTTSGSELKTTVFKEGDEWLYRTGISDPPEKWHYRNFDDSEWKRGTSPFGYRSGKHNTVLEDMKGNYKSIYVRKRFHIHANNKVRSVTLSVECDGPFVAYLNMIEVIRSDKRGRGDILDLSGFGHELDGGENVLSIKCSNDDINSDSFMFNPTFQLIQEE